MVYPTTVLVVAVGVVVLMLVKIIPTFERMFKDFGGELPGPTQVVVNMSHFMQAWIGPLLTLTVIAIIAYFQARKRSPKFRRRTDALYLKLPVFGPLLRKVAVARFTRTLGTMIASGVPILDGLDIVAKTAGNMVIEEALNDVRSAISEGKTIAEPLGESGVFPGMVVQMIAVGEETGAMENMLSKIADFYDDEVDAAVDALTAMLEPLMMVGPRRHGRRHADRDVPADLQDRRHDRLTAAPPCPSRRRRARVRRLRATLAWGPGGCPVRS